MVQAKDNNVKSQMIGNVEIHTTNIYKCILVKRH